MFRLYMAIAAAIIVTVPACDRKKSSEATTATESSAITAARNDESLLREEIARGLEDQFNVTSIPVGDVTIQYQFIDPVEEDIARKRFKSGYVKTLKQYETQGLVQRQPQLDAEKLLGESRTFTITPTERARNARDEKLSTSDWLRIRDGTCEVSQIVRTAPYQSPRLPQSEEYRLVLGTYTNFPTAFGKALMKEKSPNSANFKFRALLKLNPFTKRYTFQTADWGDLQKDDWATHNVE